MKDQMNPADGSNSAKRQLCENVGCQREALMFNERRALTIGYKTTHNFCLIHSMNAALADFSFPKFQFNGEDSEGNKMESKWEFTKEQPDGRIVFRLTQKNGRKVIAITYSNQYVNNHYGSQGIALSSDVHAVGDKWQREIWNEFENKFKEVV